MASKHKQASTEQVLRNAAMQTVAIDEMVNSVNTAVNVEHRWDLKELSLHGQRAREMEIIKLLTEILQCLKSSR